MEADGRRRIDARSFRHRGGALALLLSGLREAAAHAGRAEAGGCRSAVRALAHVAKRDLPKLWKALDRLGLATPNVNLVTDIIACPGLDYCSLANARSIPIAQELTRRFNHDT